MKILESQNSVLSNHEVHQHLVDYQSRHKSNNRRGPGNLATLLTEVGGSRRSIQGKTRRLEELINKIGSLLSTHLAKSVSWPGLEVKVRRACRGPSSREATSAQPKSGSRQG